MENTTKNSEFADLDPIRTTEFEADGVTYYIDRTSKLSIERNKRLEQFKLYTLYGRDADGILSENRRAYDFVNQAKPADAAVTLNNVLNAVNDLARKESPVLYLCTLFINEAGEDKGAYDRGLADQKIERWKRARPVIPYDFFLALAFVYLNISREAWSALTQAYSGLMPQNPTLPES